MEGRWTIVGTGTHDAEFGVTGRGLPYVEGPSVEPGDTVPVVPCDDAAVRRVADALRHAPPGKPEEHALLALRAARETP